MLEFVLQLQLAGYPVQAVLKMLRLVGLEAELDDSLLTLFGLLDEFVVVEENAAEELLDLL